MQRGITRPRGQPVEICDLVRLRLSPAERRREGGKLPPVLSPMYKVAEVLRGGWTRRLPHLQDRGKRGDVEVRHYNDLVCLLNYIEIPTQRQLRLPSLTLDQHQAVETARTVPTAKATTTGGRQGAAPVPDGHAVLHAGAFSDRSKQEALIEIWRGECDR